MSRGNPCYKQRHFGACCGFVEVVRVGDGSHSELDSSTMTRLPVSQERTISESTPPSSDGTGHTTSIRPLAAPAPRFASGADLIALEPAADATAPVSGRRTAYGAGLIIAGKYQLLRLLGTGGMGEVWVAHHLDLDIDVAVKFIGVLGDSESGLGQRLLEEARNTARLGHPAIVRALDFGHTERGEPFIVLELLAGVDLATHLEKTGALSAEHAVATLLPIAHALSAVHESGIVHRDIKPENVFLTQIDFGLQAKLLDFGIARKADRVARLTVKDTAVGTPDYMSPEQARGESTTAATDQWSFCVVLFEAIARQRPFDADNYSALLRAIVDDAPCSLASRGIDQPELWAIIERGLAKQTAARHASMRDLGEALARWLLERGVQEDAVGTSLRRAWLREAPRSLPAGSLLVGDAARAELASGPIVSLLEEILLPESDAPDQHSGPDLEALAELHRGGDPEERLRRDAQRRVIVTLFVIILVIAACALSVLVGTGVIVW